MLTGSEVERIAAGLDDHTCTICGRPSNFEGRCGPCIAAEYDDYEDDGCYECGGEGFVSDCVEEWACVDPEYGCDYCTRRCPLCTTQGESEA